jgi:5-(carboxyamino)imidazole ribonucleotide mutase
MAKAKQPLVGVIMGSRSDAEHLAPARELLTELGVPHEVRIVSARTIPYSGGRLTSSYSQASTPRSAP